MKAKLNRLVRFFYRYGIFLLLIAFVISCSMMLFVETLTAEMGLVLTSENVGVAAKLTFVNVFFLSILITIVDGIRRKISVDRPVKAIVDGATRMMHGDFKARIPKQNTIYVDEKFNEIIDCFNTMAEELSGTETLRTDFIANVSHEIKTPLAVMQNYGTLLSRPGLTEEMRIEYSKCVTDAARRMSDLITNILKLNKLENQQIFPVFQTYNLGEQLCECLLAFEELWEAKELELETEIEEDVFVQSDPEMMSLVWNNLFSNAIKFTEQGGTIDLKLITEDDEVVVKIKDTGCGISKDIGRHIFDKFYQGDTSHATQGNGLGLALVKRVVDITGCTISVESELGKGTTFIVKMRRIADGED